MSVLTRIGLIAILVGSAACGGSPTAAVMGDPAANPLTLEQWKKLPAATKYQIDTFERLKAGEPKLMDQRTWDKFTREVLIPARKKDQQPFPK